MADSTDIIQPKLPASEIVYRRIAASNAKHWIKNGRVSASAFLPNRGDIDGLSLTRAKTAQQAAETGRTGKQFYAVPVVVGDALKHPAIQITADAPDHALIPGWTFATRDSNAVREGADHLAAICGLPEGPFDGKSGSI